MNTIKTKDQDNRFPKPYLTHLRDFVPCEKPYLHPLILCIMGHLVHHVLFFAV